MQRTTTHRASTSWARELHDPILSDGYGPLAAFDQPPQRPATPRQPGLFRRLHIGLQKLRLLRKLDTLGQRADAIEKQLEADANDAHKLAQLFRFNPLIEARRRTLRRELNNVIADFRQVRQQLDNLSAELS